jgi:hypothetical protein
MAAARVTQPQHAGQPSKWELGPDRDADGEVAGSARRDAGAPSPADAGTPPDAGAPPPDAGAPPGKGTPREGGGPAEGGAPSPAVPTAASDPCGGGSLAATYTPTSTGITASVDPADATEFGSTSKYAAGFGLGACRSPSGWRFHLTGLTVQVASAVQAGDWALKTHIADANDPAITAGTYPAVVRDLNPTASATTSARCAGRSFAQRVTNYSTRRNHWHRPFVVDHEAFHRRDWDTFYRRELTLAEQQIWGHSLPLAAAADASAAVAAARPTLTNYMIAAYNPRACAAYAPEQEVRAYTNGVSQYQTLVSAIQARATAAHWRP